MGSDGEPVPGLGWALDRDYVHSVDAGKEVEGETAGPSSSLRSGFLLDLVALSHFMRPSLRKDADAALSSAAWQEIRVRSGRGDKREGGAFNREWFLDGGIDARPGLSCAGRE